VFYRVQIRSLHLLVNIILNLGRFASSGPSIQKMVIKEGNVVDPESELQDVAHVLKDGKDVYNAVLNHVDLTSDKNSYYKLQVLEHDHKKKFWVFRSWGRVGTTIGGTKLDKFSSKNEAIKLFKNLFNEKTQNNWEDRNSFIKHPNSYFPVDIDYGGDDQQIMQLQPGKSLLPKSIQDLICMIFDVQQMKQAMLEFEIDLEKMPLGKLSKKQLLNACSALKEISDMIQKKSINNSNIVGATNKFYTLVPHNFGIDKLPLIDSMDKVVEKMQMIEALLEIEMAYEMRSSINANDDKDPIDLHYEKLNTTIEILDKNDELYRIIDIYVKNTHASTHSIKLDILEIFCVERHGERDRYKKYKDYDNRMLLWHGSRVTNFAGILSQGLRIAPPEAPVTGYMFGKGIYFADMVTKSANYCHAHLNNNIGLLLLSEVAIGAP
jgi:poly [ADP-ribose] polymerase 1